jgi:hypothetical protein
MHRTVSPLAQKRAIVGGSLQGDHRHRGGAQAPTKSQPRKEGNRRAPAKGVIATLSGVPRYDTLWIRGTIQGQWAIAPIDGGATHNFIDVAWVVARRALQTEEFEGFEVAVADGHTLGCLERVPDLEVKLGNYTMRDTFYVVDLANTDVVLGVQWLITLGKISTNYQTLEMGSRDNEGKKIVVRGMSTRAPRIMSTKRMERIFGHGEATDALSRKPTACSLMEISADWKSHLLVEYSKNKFACEILDGQVQTTGTEL